MEGLLTYDMKRALEKVITQCFYNNRIIDRIVSILSVPMVMPSTADIVHHKLAHIYPVLADFISDYMGDRDCTSIYGETPRGDQTYEVPLDCFNKMLEIHLELENVVRDAIILAGQINDYTTRVYMESFLLKLIPITRDMLTLVDKAEMYGESKLSWMKFDHDIDKFNIVGDYI